MARNSYNGLYGVHKAIVIRGVEDIPESVSKRRGTSLIQVAVVGHHNKAIKMILDELKDPHDMDAEFLKKLSPNNETAFPYAQLSTTYFRGQDNSLASAFASLFKKGDDVIPVIYPKAGDMIWVQFEKGDISRPIYVGTLADEVNGKVSVSEGSTDLTSSGGSGVYEGEGYIMIREETGGVGCGMISSGAGDAGGKSYGCQQLSLTMGSLREFVNWLKNKHSDFYKKYFAGQALASAGFDAAWKKAAKDDKDEFTNLQMTYAKNTFLLTWQKMAKRKTGIDFSRSMALNELSWVRSAQNGAYSEYVVAGVTSKMSDKEVITTIYDHLINNVGSIWSGCSGDVQNGVRNRLIREKKELIGLIGKQYASGSISSASFGKYIWPVPGHTNLTSTYNEWRETQIHGGIDISDGSIRGAKIVAVAAGTVVEYHEGYEGGGASNNSGCGYGHHVVIKHSGDKYFSVYGHMNEPPLVKNGAKVVAGQHIGYVGNTGSSTGPHLHYGLHEDHYRPYVDPSKFLGIDCNKYGAIKKLKGDNNAD